MKTVGENFKDVRELLGLRHEDVYQRLGYKQPANVSLLESRKGIPTPTRIQEMAAVLGCEPQRLLVGVVFPHDDIRGIATEQHTADGAVTTAGKPTTDTDRRKVARTGGDRIAEPSASEVPHARPLPPRPLEKITLKAFIKFYQDIEAAERSARARAKQHRPVPKPRRKGRKRGNAAS